MISLCQNCHKRFDTDKNGNRTKYFCSIHCRTQMNRLSLEDHSQAYHMWLRELRRRLDWSNEDVYSFLQLDLFKDQA